MAKRSHINAREEKADNKNITFSQVAWLHMMFSVNITGLSYETCIKIGNCTYAIIKLLKFQ